MARCRLPLVCVLAVLFGFVALIAEPQRPQDQFVSVNGVRLQYLDWGGDGRALVFLAGLGDDVHRFDALAPKFIDEYRAVGFTRRGQGLSEKPSSGYDLPTLTNDIRGFMDAERIDRATLIGHSMAGPEMTRFAAEYPERLTALVYLDAAYDFQRAYEVGIKTGLSKPNPDPSLEAISRAARVRPDYQRVRVPALAFFSLWDRPYILPDMNEQTRTTSELVYRTLDASGYKREQVDLFKREVEGSRVVEWHDTNHVFFSDPKHVDDTPRIIREFLSSIARR